MEFLISVHSDWFLLNQPVTADESPSTLNLSGPSEEAKNRHQRRTIVSAIKESPIPIIQQLPNCLWISLRALGFPRRIHQYQFNRISSRDVSLYNNNIQTVSKYFSNA